jgi:hypothetical protein
MDLSALLFAHDSNLVIILGQQEWPCFIQRWHQELSLLLFVLSPHF